MNPLTGSTPPRLAMRGVRKSFAGVQALAGVDLRVEGGEVHALIGENGAGKSTIMKVLAGAYRPDEGQMELDGVHYRPVDPLAARRAGVAMIYQELTLAPDLSVEQNVMLGCEKTRAGVLEKRLMRRVVAQTLDELGHAELAPQTKVRELGPGARQLVEIARALVGEARIVVLDEPTSSLSQKDAEHLFAVIQRLRERGVAVVYISHFLEEVRFVCQRYTVLRDGRSVASGAVATTSNAEWLRQMAGRDLNEFFPRVAHTRGEVLLDLQGLAGASLPREASLQLHRGEIFGIAGLVGAGRTELVRALFGLDPFVRGQLRLAGIPLRSGSVPERIRRGLGLVSENRKEEGLALTRSITENLTLSRLSPFVKHVWLNKRAREAAALRWMGELGVRATSPTQAVGELSGGNQQKVALARLLHQDADVFLLDEPTRGIDVTSKVEIYRWMGRLAAAGKALLVISSYLPELFGICDRLAVMRQGKLGLPRKIEEWTETSVLHEAIQGVGA